MARHLSILVLLVSVAGCAPLTDAAADDDACPQTHEFGNYGCARLVVLPGSLPADAPSSYRWKVGAKGQEGAIETIQVGTPPLPEEVQLQMTLWVPLPSHADTATVTVVAEARDDSGPMVVGAPLPLFAVDSARHTARFAGVGERPKVDTVRLNMSR